MLAKIKANPRTTLAGLGAIVSSLLAVFHLVSPQQAAAISAAATGIGLILAGDAK